MESMNGEEAAAGSINPLLLASALVGSWEALDVLFKREDAQDPPMMIPTQDFLALLASARGRITVPDTRDVELGAYPQPASFAAGELLQGVTHGGDTALHAVARNGDRQDFLKYAGMICGRERGLLFAKNHNGDTPLHCAARAGNSKMVSLLIDLAGREGHDRKLTLLRMQNKRHETALHEAIRSEDGRILGLKDHEQKGMTIVKKLMGADPRLADYPVDGISPLYLAILLGKSTIAPTLHDMSGGNLSYSGADGQNALHVAALRDKDTVIVELLLDWNKSLTTHVDKDGSTPLHFASSLFRNVPFVRYKLRWRFPWCSIHWLPSRSTQKLNKIFEANPTALYQADNNGSFPIHVAASVYYRKAIKLFLRECPDSAGLRDAKGKTFLHVAIEKRRLGIVSYACREPSLAWILNMQDTDGNTALHLAIQARSFRMFCALFGNREVNLNITNNQGETPRDVSISKIPRGLSYSGNSENKIRYTLWSVTANHGALRRDKTEEKYFPGQKPEHQKESERLKDASQALVIATVLIATMAFSATFALPGGYRADDHTNGGTPTLAGGYVFDAFIMATSLAFICSLLATTGFMFAGISMINLITRRIYAVSAMFFVSSSVTCLSIAFALGVYMVLAPVARSTALVICVITPSILVGKDMGFVLAMVFLAGPLCTRKGLFLGMLQLLSGNILRMAIALWPFVVIFGWGGLARIHHRR